VREGVKEDVESFGLSPVDAHIRNRRKTTTREYWIQRITFAAEINAACSRDSADRHTHSVTPSVTIPSPLAKRRRR